MRVSYQWQKQTSKKSRRHTSTQMDVITMACGVQIVVTETAPSTGHPEPSTRESSKMIAEMARVRLTTQTIPNILEIGATIRKREAASSRGLVALVTMGSSVMTKCMVMAFSPGRATHHSRVSGDTIRRMAAVK